MANKKGKVYEVGAILDEKVVDGITNYLIEWTGYPKSESTWEIESNLSCLVLIAEYENRQRHNLKRKNDELFASVPKRTKSQEVC